MRFSRLQKGFSGRSVPRFLGHLPARLAESPGPAWSLFRLSSLSGLFRRAPARMSGPRRPSASACARTDLRSNVGPLTDGNGLTELRALRSPLPSWEGYEYYHNGQDQLNGRRRDSEYAWCTHPHAGPGGHFAEPTELYHTSRDGPGVWVKNSNNFLSYGLHDPRGCETISGDINRGASGSWRSAPGKSTHAYSANRDHAPSLEI